MNPIKNIVFIVVALMMMPGCDQNDFLDLKPKDQLTTELTFNTYDNIKTYAWQFYDVFLGYQPRTKLSSQVNADLILLAGPNRESEWIWQRVVVPSASASWTDPYKNIRAINIMLDNLDNAEMVQADKDHWRSVGYFFRAYNYADLVNSYGAVPLVLQALSESDPLLFGPRTPRDEVTQTILDELLWAEEHIKPDGDGPNTINVHIVRALISRFGLREGTWRKFHGLGGGEQCLKASVAASEKLMASFPDLHPNYDELFNSASLAGVTGVLLYQQYEANQITHSLTTNPRSARVTSDLTKKAVDMYLMTDGQTRWTSPLFEGDKTPYTEFRNRDRRLYYTVPPPYKVKRVPPRGWEHTGDPADREYFDLMANISDELHKTLPLTNWNGGGPVQQIPHFRDFNLGQGYNVSYTGYQCYKYYNELNNGISSEDISDAPVFRMGEVLLNYAEAKYELGAFNQATANATINKLRDRGHIARLNIDAIPDDPTRDPGVDPVLWEIRRERAVELMGEGFRWDDLRRWKKMDYVTEEKLGRWIVKAEVNNKIPIQDGADEGYISYLGVPPSPFPEYYYLLPIPSDQIVLNPELAQNPGW